MTSKSDQETKGSKDPAYFLFEDTTQCSGRSFLEKGTVPTKMSDVGEALNLEYRKEMRRLAKLGVKQHYVASFLFKPEVSAQMDSVTDFEKNSFPLLVSTHVAMVATKVKYSIERDYKDFFDEFQRHDHDWRLFYSKQNEQHVWAERTCAILGNLATIYRQRGQYAQCEAVMSPYKYVITQYNAMVLARKLSGAAENDELVCCHEMTYKYHRVYFNLANCLNRPAGTAKVLVGDIAMRIGGPHRAGSSLPTELSTLRQIAFETFRGHLRELKKNGQKARYDDHNILKPNIAAQMSSASKFKERSFPMLVDTYHELHLETEDSELQTMCAELFEEMQQNKHDWDLFYSLENSLHVWAERFTGIFLKLANIYRSEKKFDECRQVMVQYKFIIMQYNVMIKIRHNAGISDKDELVCVRGLTFRYHRCAYHLAFATTRFEGIAESLRFLMQYELDTKAGDKAEFLWIFSLLNCTPCTTAALKKISDAELQRVAVMVHRMGLVPGPTQMESTVVHVPDIRSMTWPFNDTGLSMCAACEEVESPSNILMQCARCKHVKYCSRECQKLHYPEHKEFCKIAAIANPPKNK